jgi:hypothetical protein
MEKFLQTAKPSYKSVLDLDQKIRRYILSAPFEQFPVPAEGDTPFTFIQRNLVPRFAKNRESTIMLSLPDANWRFASSDVHSQRVLH